VEVSKPLSSTAPLGQSEGEGEAPAPAGASLLYLLQTTQPGRSKTDVAKKAQTLFLNVDAMIQKHGLDVVGFITLTFAENLCCRVEAQRRFNSLATHFLRVHLVEYIAAVERQGRGAIHYHLIAVFPRNIRSGFDFETAKAARKLQLAGQGACPECKRLLGISWASANDDLRLWWKALRVASGKYGFGRCETLPVMSNAEAVARYVGSYVGGEYVAREARDKGLRTLRYSLKHRVASVRWSWVNGAGQNWRRGCAVLGALLGTDDFTAALGKTWAYHWREQIGAFGRNFDAAMRAVSALADSAEFDGAAVASKLGQLILEHEREAGKGAKCKA